MPNTSSAPETIIILLRKLMSQGLSQRNDTRLTSPTKLPTRVLFQIRCDQFDECCSKLRQLFLSHSANARKFDFGGGIISGHLSQRDVRENYVSRETSVVGNLFAQPPQLIEEGLVILASGGVTSFLLIASSLVLWQGDRLHQMNRLTLFERR